MKFLAVVYQDPCAVIEQGSWLWYVSGCWIKWAVVLPPVAISATTAWIAGKVRGFSTRRRLRRECAKWMRT